MKMVALCLILILTGCSSTTTCYFHDMRFINARSGAPYKTSFEGITWATAKEFGFYDTSDSERLFAMDTEPGQAMRVFVKAQFLFPKKGKEKEGAFDFFSMTFERLTNRVVLENHSSQPTPFLELVRNELKKKVRQKSPDVKILEYGVLKKIKVSYWPP